VSNRGMSQGKLEQDGVAEAVPQSLLQFVVGGHGQTKISGSKSKIPEKAPRSKQRSGEASAIV